MGTGVTPKRIATKYFGLSLVPVFPLHTPLRFVLMEAIPHIHLLVCLITKVNFHLIQTCICALGP